MGLFRTSKKSKKLANDYWFELQSLAQFEELTKKSGEQPIVIFKHSTRCSISHFVHRRLAANWNFQSDELAFYYLDLIAHRDISNAVADHTGVKHESPQLILLYNNRTLYHASHDAINLEQMKQRLPSPSN